MPADVQDPSSRRIRQIFQSVIAYSTIAGRKTNAAGVYRCTDSELVRGKCILLVDDIVTTGATLSSAAAVLKAAGAASVEAVTVARSEKNAKKIQTDKKEHSFSLF